MRLDLLVEEKMPGREDVVRAAHELGHGTGLGHHDLCLMEASQRSALFDNPKYQKFCEPCKTTIAQFRGN